MVVSGGYDYGDLVVDPTAGFVSWPDQAAAAIPPPLLAALRQYLAGPAGEGEPEADEEFMMYEFKVRRCARARSHDWTGCPYAHPGEAARRRDPRRVTYSGEPCPDFRRRPGGTCPRGNACKFAHGTFELWLHPSRYRTRPCRAGAACGRRVCFFAHSQDELRGEAAAGKVLSPKSTLVPLWESPPVSPAQGRRWLDATDEADVGMEMEDLMLAMRELSIGKAKPAAPEMPVLPPVTEEDGPDLGWVSELVM